MRKIIFLFALSFAAFIFSCQKEYDVVLDENPPGTDTSGGGIDTSTNGSSNKLLGTWKLISATSNTQSTQEYDYFGAAEKSVTFLSYTTIGNAGTYTFSDSLVNGTGVAYTVSDTSFNYIYENEVLIDSIILPFTFQLPPTNLSSKYHLIGADSIYFPEGGIADIPGASGTQTVASGARYSISADMLTLTTQVQRDTIINNAGVMTHLVQTAHETVLLQKQ